MAAGRRRTDVPDALWSGAPSGGLSDSPTDPSRARTERAAGGLRTPDGPRQLSRSRLPLPPVPPVPSGPRTTAAPFRAVPAPEVLADVMVPAGGPLDRTPAMAQTAAPARMRPSRPWTADDAALVSSGQGLTSVPTPRTTRSAPAGTPASPPYGDWTKPSSAGDTGRALAGPALDFDDYLSGPIGRQVSAAPSTTMIPERTVGGRSERSAAAFDDDEYDYDDYDDVPLARSAAAPAAVRGPETGPAVGGRAAKRAERNANEMARQKAAKRNGVAAVSAADVLDEEAQAGRPPRRVAKGVLAMVIVALCVLGAYSFVSPHTSAAAAKKPAATASDPVVAPDTTELPALATTPVVAPPAAVVPVRVPVTVLNATTINGLAAKVAGTLGAKGWQSPGVGAYKATDVAASTVFFTQGDEKQRQAAVQLVDQFPQLTGPAPRFFALPAGVSAPGLVVVLTGDWRP